MLHVSGKTVHFTVAWQRPTSNHTKNKTKNICHNKMREANVDVASITMACRDRHRIYKQTWQLKPQKLSRKMFKPSQAARAFASALYPLGLSASILLLLGGHFGEITSDNLATMTVWANAQVTPSSSVCLEPANKKLRLLENLEYDHGNGDGSTNSSKNEDSITFCIMQEVAAWGPAVLTENEKMSAILYWRCPAHTYPNLSHIVNIYLT